MTRAEKYFPLVKNVIFSLMIKYGVNGQNREDLYQTAYLGYLKGLKTYKKGKSSIVTWCYYSIRKELQTFCKCYHQTSGFSKHREKVMPREIIVSSDTIEQVHYQTPLQEILDKEMIEALDSIK